MWNHQGKIEMWNHQGKIEMWNHQGENVKPSGKDRNVKPSGRKCETIREREKCETIREREKYETITEVETENNCELTMKETKMRSGQRKGKRKMWNGQEREKCQLLAVDCLTAGWVFDLPAALINGVPVNQFVLLAVHHINFLTAISLWALGSRQPVHQREMWGWGQARLGLPALHAYHLKAASQWWETFTSGPQEGMSQWTTTALGRHSATGQLCHWHIEWDSSVTMTEQDS